MPLQRVPGRAYDFGEGLDFADALHLSSSKGADAFATFDKNLLKKADMVPSVRLIQP